MILVSFAYMSTACLPHLLKFPCTTAIKIYNQGRQHRIHQSVMRWKSRAWEIGRTGQLIGSAARGFHGPFGVRVSQTGQLLASY